MKEVKVTPESTPAPTPMVLLEMAVEKGVDIDQLEKLMALQQRWEKEQARKAFLKALGDFQYICPIIPKKSEVKFSGKVQYVFADLATIIETIKEALKKSNLSYRWETDDTGEFIKITCVLGHIDGHEERNTLSAKEDTTGSKNGIQARGSTRSYLHRYSLIGSLGIGSADTDDDGKASKKEPEKPKLPELIPSHPRWNGAKIAIQAGNITLQQIRTNYILSEENADKLCSV